MVHLSIDHATQEAIRLVPMCEQHLDQAHDLSRALNWPYRREDWVFALDLGHGLVAEHKGQVLGTALWWLYGDDVASVGMVIVSPQARRQGIGARLMDALLARLEGRRIVLNATPDGLPLYERLGFLPCGAVHQHQAVLTAAPRIDSDATIRPLGPDDLAALRALDRAGSGMDRDGLIAALRAIGQIKVLERDGVVQAYGCARVWGRGVVIGPVVAETREDAQSIIAALTADHEGGFLRIDVTRRSDLSPWLEAIGLPQVDAVVAMAKGPPTDPSGRLAVFALANQSLG
ncbi:GNAT family N-acetyltransferase [Novosphingobium sp.]|uniref:GNAT family N-acetyltransferase n=1 Tax=Novosphingobium sp. TaxID=1874826 RepID=UPI0031D38552